MHLEKKKKEKENEDRIRLKMNGKLVCFIRIHSDSALCFGAAAV